MKEDTEPTEQELYALILEAAKLELIHAQMKFPSNTHLTHAFSEEAGEVVKALMDQEQKGKESKDVVNELIQCIAMSLRLMIQGDPAFKKYEFDVKYVQNYIRKKKRVVKDD